MITLLPGDMLNGVDHVEGWWLNFILYRDIVIGPIEDPFEDVREKLIPWGGRLQVDMDTRLLSIEFDNDEDATVFVLRWS